MDKTKIDWCDSSWNPVTGCLHTCEYCYARSMVRRFEAKNIQQSSGTRVLNKPVRELRNGKFQRVPYPYGFEPTFHKYRLGDYAKKAGRTIFVGSMTDLFGEWVPDAWIEEVLEACMRAPQHRYLFLTKNPKRYEVILDGSMPSNMWFGWSQTGPLGLGSAFSCNHNVNTFVSIEPLLTPFEQFQIKGIGWAIVGAETGNRKGKVIPKKEWVDDIAKAFRDASVPLFMKDSLRELMGDDFKQEFPWER